MNRNYLVGNWKMNLAAAEAVKLAEEISTGIKSAQQTGVWVAPSSITIPHVVETLKNTEVQTGAQNCHWETKGAFTGELSVEMLKEAGCSFAIVGHSERRHQMGETNEIVIRRALSVLKSGFKAILCIGETEEEREQSQTQEVVRNQLAPCIEQLDSELASRLLIAYEPVWAIGTGKVAAIEEIDSLHKYIQELWSNNSETQCSPVLYGGSVSPDNYEEIISLDTVSGALVGGASLSSEKFLKLLDISESCSK